MLKEHGIARTRRTQTKTVHYEGKLFKVGCADVRIRILPIDIKELLVKRDMITLAPEEVKELAIIFVDYLELLYEGKHLTRT